MERTLLALVDVLYESLTAPDRFVIFLRQLSDAAGASSVTTLDIDPMLEHGITICSSHHERADCAQFEQRFFRTSGKLWFERGEPHVRTGAVLNGSQFATEEEILASGYYLHLLKDMDILHSTAVFGPVGGGRICMLTVNRNRALGPWNEADMPLLQALAPHWVRHQQLSDRHAATPGSGRSSRGMGVFEFGPGFDLRNYNRTGETLLRLGWFSRTPDQQLRMRDARSQAGWLAAQRAAASTDSNPPPFVVHDQDGEMAGFAAVQSTTTPMARKLLFVRPIQPVETATDLAALLRATHGLTAAEAALAVTLRHQDSLADAAKALGITVGTARQRLQAVFEKMHLHRQADLYLALEALADLGDHRYRLQVPSPDPDGTSLSP